MYRHEAIAIARTVMERARITEELKPWVVDAILAAACNAHEQNQIHLPPIPPNYELNKVGDMVSITPSIKEQRTPVAWRRRSRMDDRMPAWVYSDDENKPSQVDICGYELPEWQPLYAD